MFVLESLKDFFFVDFLGFDDFRPDVLVARRPIRSHLPILLRRLL